MTGEEEARGKAVAVAIIHAAEGRPLSAAIGAIFALSDGAAMMALSGLAQIALGTAAGTSIELVADGDIDMIATASPSNAGEIAAMRFITAWCNGDVDTAYALYLATKPRDDSDAELDRRAAFIGMICLLARTCAEARQARRAAAARAALS